MVIASTESQNKYFHTRKCRHAKIIKPKNEIFFKTVGMAKSNGYNPCPLCITSEKIYSQIPEQYIKDLSSENIDIIRTARTVYAITSKPHYKTKYKLVLSNDGTSIVCFHLNGVPGTTDEYHLQAVFKDGVISALSYIRKHDEWRNGLFKEKDLEHKIRECFGYEANVLKQKPKKNRHRKYKYA